MLREISVLCERKYAETLGDMLMNGGAMSVTTEDADADSPDEQPLFGEPGLEPKTLAWKRSRLRILADEKFDLADELAVAAKVLGIKVPQIEADTPVPDADWVRVTQAQFGPIHVSDKLWIVPSWDEPPVPDAVNIRLDPGVAFGTGAHPTTQMCLQWLAEHDLKGKSVLDYGCGTGILAIAAGKLGAQRVDGVDIDPQAVDAAKSNAQGNAVQAGFYLPEGFPGGSYNVIVANILSNPLKMLASSLLANLAPQGSLILSGILAEQAEGVIAAYATTKPGITLTIWRKVGDWVCSSGTKNA